MERKPHRGLILHSDKGAQYRSDRYKDFAYHHKAVCSYTRIVFSCADNASQESFHASLKKECLYQRKPQSYEETMTHRFRYIEGSYNPKRFHSKLGFKSTDTFERDLKLKKITSIESANENDTENIIDITNETKIED